MTMHPIIETHRQQILDLAAQHGVSDVRVFGSMARGDSNDESDIDLLVTPNPGTSLFALGGLLAEVEAMTGRRVDLVSARALHPSIRDRILSEAQPL